jgi:FeS assembly SUF system regulator
MLQISKLSDYAVIILGVIGTHPGDCHSASAIAEKIRLACTTVSKCLKLLGSAELLVSVRGPKGGYQLVKPLAEISLLNVIEAIEGKVQLTECVSDNSNCCLQGQCDFRPNWQGVNQQVAQLLAGISIVHMVEPALGEVEYPLHFHDRKLGMMGLTGERV